MIHDDIELKVTQERVAYFQDLLLQLRVRATPEEIPLISSGYRAEIKKMQEEVLEYLTRHASAPVPGQAVAVKEPTEPIQLIQRES